MVTPILNKVHNIWYRVESIIDANVLRTLIASG